MIETGEEQQPYYAKLAAEARAKSLAAGVELIKLSQEDEKKLKQLRYDSQWPIILKRSPKFGPRFYALAGN